MAHAEDQLRQILGLLWVHPGGRLIEQQQLRRGGQRAGDLHFALVAIAQVRGLHMGEVGDADVFQNGHRFGLRRPLGRKVAANVQGRLQQRVAAGPVEPDHHVLQHRHRVKQPDILEGTGDPGVHHLVGL